MGRRKQVDTAAVLRIGPGPMTEAIRALRDRERMLLHAYMHFGREQGGRIGEVGVCWPTDAEVGAYLGRSPATIRRSRAVLATMATPWITLRYVGPFGRLPDGTTSLHGQNVIMILKVGAPEEAPAVKKFIGAMTTVKRIERELAEARALVDGLKEEVHQVHDRMAANDDASSHNAPSLTIPGLSPRKAPAPASEGGGESRVA